MSRRRAGREPLLPDWHLWTAVAETVSPLRRDRLAPAPQRADTALPTPSPPPAPAPKPPPFILPMPPYRPDGRQGGVPEHALEPNLRQRLVRGRTPIDGRIDLHGMRQDEAHAALIRYLEASAARGDRTVLVITGKGLKKLEDDAAVIIERGVLRAMLPVWLSEKPLAGIVSGWDRAAQGHGGDGAFYVRLKRPRARR